MTRTLLVEMGVPHFLWSDALLTSTYLLNRLPSSPLGCEVPLRRLHHDHDLFVLLPQVFGCEAFVHDHTPNTSMMNAPFYQRGVHRLLAYAKRLSELFSRSMQVYCLYQCHIL